MDSAGRQGARAFNISCGAGAFPVSNGYRVERIHGYPAVSKNVQMAAPPISEHKNLEFMAESTKITNTLNVASLNTAAQVDARGNIIVPPSKAATGPATSGSFNWGYVHILERRSPLFRRKFRAS